MDGIHSDQKLDSIMESWINFDEILIQNYKKPEREQFGVVRTFLVWFLAMAFDEGQSN